MQKQAEAIEYQGEKKQKKNNWRAWKRTGWSNKYVKKDFDIDRDGAPHKKNVLLDEMAYEFDSIKDKINPNKLIHNFMTEERSPKDFRGYKICENNLKTRGIVMQTQKKY